MQLIPVYMELFRNQKKSEEWSAEPKKQPVSCKKKPVYQATVKNEEHEEWRQRKPGFGQVKTGVQLYPLELDDKVYLLSPTLTCSQRFEFRMSSEAAKRQEVETGIARYETGFPWC